MTRLLASPFLLSFLVLTVSTSFAQSANSDIISYIDSAWSTLTRNPISCEAMVDPKLPPGESILYFPAEMPPTVAAKAAAAKCKVRIEPLPQKITAPGSFDLSRLKRHGLLYLPNEYVVPGGRFNEMYGWDSYFIIVGLVESGRLKLARGMVDNFVFEMDHYGAILNANRTYYLTRSQPPFFTSMALAVYEADKDHRFTNKSWLRKVYTAAQKDYAMWTSGEHRAGNTGFSRYFDFGEGPVPEELHNQYQYYRDAARGMIAHRDYSHFIPAQSADDLVVADIPKNVAEAHGLTGRVTFSPDFYKGDRAIRESGFDITNRFGAYGSETHHFAPVCLNSLLYKVELDLAALAESLGNKSDAADWKAAAENRKQAINRTFFDGRLYSDYRFTDNSTVLYPFASTFYPLAFGIAEKQQADAVISHLDMFAKTGGVQTSTALTGLQWDAPYGWAPLQMLTVDGLRRYGYKEEADTVAKAWLSLIVESFRREGMIREKYDVVARTSEFKVTAGYEDNVVGFGWTNGVFLHLLHQLSAADQKVILAAPLSKAATTN